MARIKINDLPENRAISKKEMRIVFGGVLNIPAVCQTPSGIPSPFPYTGNVPNNGGSSSSGGSSTDSNFPNSTGDEPGGTGDHTVSGNINPPITFK